MKRLAILVVVLLSLPHRSNGTPVETAGEATRFTTNLSECRGIDLSSRILDLVVNTKEDPGKTLLKRQAKGSPAEIRCASKLWRLRHQNETRSTRKPQQGKATDVATHSATSASRRPSAPTLSPTGRRALSRPFGAGTGQSSSEAIISDAPPNDLRPVIPIRTRPLRELPAIPPPRRGEGHVDRLPEPIRPEPAADTGEPDTARQTFLGAAISAPTATGISFEGVGVGITGFSPSSNPPDVEGHVGATQYVQWNNTSFAVFSKTGTLLYGPAAGNTLFQTLGGACASHNDGDPVVNYDILAGRWILSQFAVGASPNFSHQCVAVSATGDATGSYYVYDFVTDATNFVDYPHMATWPDGYYMTTHVFNAAGTAQVASRVHVFERDKMLQGQPARQLQANLKKYSNKFQYGFLPADLDSLTPPPAGEAEFVMGPDPGFLNRVDATRLAVTWGATPTVTLTETTLSVTSYGNAPCVSNTSGQQNRDCVPQPSPALATDDLDNIAGHMMYRLAYRNFGGSPVQESLLANITVNGSSSSPAHGAVRWFEFRNAGSSATTPTVFQQGTFDPDTSYRWLGSIAMDKDHNIALGYSKSSPAIKPAIFLTGRLSTDTVNTMGAETTLLAGAGVQLANAGNRWGDYSAMTLDPIDQCTFWYTNEYLQANGIFNWATRIASYKFPSCTSAPAWGTISGTITSCATGAPLSGVMVTLSNGFAASSDASGNYSIPVPAGTYTVTAADSDRSCSTGSPATVDVSVSSGGTSSQNFCMTGSSNIQFSTLSLDDSVNGNNNGIVNSNECVNLNIAVKNNGCANETAISTTLTTSTTGVTVNQGSATYPDLAIDASGVNSIPFKIQTSSSFVCGTIINLTLNLTYASGSKSIGVSVPTCLGGPNQSIATSSIALTDSSQPDRLGRDGVPSTCSGKGCPGAINSAGTRNYRTFNFTNSGGAQACITVQINAACGSADIESAAYLNSYTPPTAQGDAAGNLCLGYLGDTGISGLGTTVSSSSYSFEVPASSNFVIVVSTATGSTTCAQFSGVVSGFFNFTPGPGACPTCIPPATPTISAGSATTFCTGGSVVLTSSAASGNQWYLNNSVIGGATNNTYTALATGNYSVTTTVAGCTSAQSTATTVTVNPIPSMPTASNGGPYCQGSTIALSTPIVSGATYSWTGPNGFTSALQNPTRSSASTADAGTYSVTETVNGCTSAAGSTTVVVNTIPATPTPSNGGPYCQGATISISTPTVSGATYSWTGPNGFTSSLQNPTRANGAVADGGSYSVTVTVNGCASAAGSTSVLVNAIPATPTASNGGPYCAGATISLSTPILSGATYSWTGPNGFTSALQNPTRANAAVADGGSYSVTVTVSNCTSAAGTTSVVVNAIPATPAASNGGPYCEGATIALFTPTVSGATYSWTGPNGFTSALQNPTHTNTAIADAGSYSVTVTVNGCTSAAGSTNVVVNPIPATLTASNGGPYCEGAIIALSTPTVSGATYSWTGPNGFTSALQSPTRSNVTAADSGSYSVTVTVNGCTSAAGATSVLVNPTPATPTASNGGPYCEGATIALSTPTVSGATYSWTGPNGFTSALQNPTRTNAAVADGGSYSVTVTVSGCTSAAGSTSVVVNAIPATPTASNGGPYCEGATISLSTPSVSGATYSWTGPNGFISALQNPTRSNATVANGGGYFVTVTVNGCTSAAGATTVIVNAAPATPTASNDGPYCEGATISLSTPTVSGATYSWTGPNGFTSLQQNPTRSGATTADGATYSVTLTVNGCVSAAGSTSVVVNAIPATPSASNGGPYCEGATISLFTPTVTGATYSWTGPNGFTSALQNPTLASAALADAGSYSVTVTVNGCTSPAGSTDVVVNAAQATPTASNGGPYCEGATISLSTPTLTGATYAWTGPDGFTSSQQNPTRSNVTTADAGTYSVTVTISGCTSAAGSTSVVVNATPATPTAANGGPYCQGATISLSTPTVSGAIYSWTGPNGFTSSLQNPTRSNAAVADGGGYSVTVTVNGCTSAAGSTNVVVNAIPATPTASNGGPYCVGATISVSTLTVSGGTYSWTGPNGFTSSQQNPTHSNATLADGGSYSVTVTVNGCTSGAGSTSVVVNAIPATPTASNDGPYCEGATISLSTPTVSGGTYSWTGPNGFTSSTQNPTHSGATTADAGSYSVTVTVNGCTSAAGSTNVVVNTIPATPTATNGGPYCEGGTISLFTPTVSGATYSWTGPGSFTSSQQNPVRSNATLSDAGSYAVTVIVNGCTSAAGSTSVVVNATPANPTISAGGPTTFCAGGSVTLTSSSASGNQWYVNGNLINGATGNTYNATASGNYAVVVTTNGCSSALSAATVVTVNPLPPTPTITPGGPTTFCTGGSVLLTSSSASGNQWYLGGNPIGGASNQTYAATASGNYTVVVTNGCSSAPSTATTVTVNPIPAAPTISAGGPTTFCDGGSVTLTSSSSVGNQWYRNGSLLGSETGQTTIATLPGDYSVTATVSGCTSASSTATTVTVNPKPNVTISVPSPMYSGAGATASVIHECAGATFVWSITGGTITSGNGTRIVTFTAGGAGTLTLFITVTNSFGCSDSKSANVTVQLAPFGAPPYLSASATGTTTANLIWAAVASADHYEIVRSTDNVNWTLRGTNTLTTFSESGLTPSTTYLYKVRAIKADSTASGYSVIDPATTIVFTDASLTACPAIIRAVHITELRAGVNMARASVGLAAFTFTDPSLVAGSSIKAIHVTELRTALASFLSAIGVTPTYTDPTIAAGTTNVKGAHIQELRDLIR